MTQNSALKNLAITILEKLFVPVIVSAVITLLLAAQLNGWFQIIKDKLFPLPPLPTIELRSIIINGLQGSTELNTADLFTETVVVTNQDRTLGQVKLGNTKVIYQAIGKVRAGIDLSQLEAKDVNMIEGKIHILLPPPHLLDTSIDVARSSVLDSHRNWFGPAVEADLQTMAQKEALYKIKAAACEKGLLKVANAQAKQTVEQILRTAGYKEIVIDTQSPQADTCPSI